MFKSRAKERRIFTSRKRIRSSSSLFSVFASIVLIFLVLELLTRIFVDLSGNRNQFARANTESDISQAYRLKFVQPDLPPNELSQLADTSLKAISSISVGYHLLGNQKNDYWQINSDGFRDREPLATAKPKDEIRIFLLGGSTAFGYGNSSNQATISEFLEKRLQQRLAQQISSPQLYKPDLLPADPVEKQKYIAKPAKIKPGKYRVINAGIPGYASGNELAQLALQILKHKPDLIIVLDGYQDLMLQSNLEAVSAPQLNLDAEQPKSFAEYFSHLIEPLENKSYLAKIAQNRWLNSPKANQDSHFLFNEKLANFVEHLPQSSEELDKRVERYIGHQKQILSLSAAARIPLIVAIQPEITGRNPSQLTDTEGKIATELGRTYIKQMRDSYPKLIEASQRLAKAFPHNMKTLDLYQLTEKYPSPSFIDPIHLNEVANEKVAEQLYYTIASLSKMQVVPKKAPLIKPKYNNAYSR